MFAQDRTSLLHELYKSMMQNNQHNNSESLYHKYTQILSNEYLEHYSPKQIIEDISLCESLSSSNEYAVTIIQNNNINTSKVIKQKDNINVNPQCFWQIKLFRFGQSVSLSRSLPLIENFGVKLLDEYPQKMTFDHHVIYICDFGILIPEDFIHQLNNELIINKLKQVIILAFKNQIDNDILNKLTITANFDYQQIMLIRALAHYITQTNLPFSKEYIKSSIVLYPEIVKNLFSLFATKFMLDISNNKNDNNQQTTIYQNLIIQDLQQVLNLDHDFIIKTYLSIMNAMTRTNYYQNNTQYLSFKILANNLACLPKPHPLYEIFVYAIDFEAIHLRGGKVARGGIRWSDRYEDFRTEVLGLLKAQIVKNAIILPTGAKGCFVCKYPQYNVDDKECKSIGVNCYKKFITALLELTDNIIDHKIIHPQNTICYDETDPYLVVAADKGTTTFSDYANELAIKHHFWLGDAFASGGSDGYDHKQIGITSRGAWESAKRHFRHLNINIQQQDFTVVAIGDMSGDVFGNAMLLSKHIKLIAAFNHKHIFLDPNPISLIDSFNERQRLFNLPSSTWQNYDNTKISNGGGIFERHAKAINLSLELQALFNTNEISITPNECIRKILQLSVDLLYNGGIGIYIKSSSESHHEVQDKSNDNVRVDANLVKAKVIVEGGNCGVTQLARVEYAKCGGLIYTDAIDNSAGVSCSDHEVNIKILFAPILQKHEMTVLERNELLKSMTNEVTSLVLRDNYMQTQILQYVSARSKELFNIHMNFMDKLEKDGILDRNIEFLPDNKTIIERKNLNIGLTLPELSVLLAYAKIKLNKEILTSSIVAEDTFHELLINYFPQSLFSNNAKLPIHKMTLNIKHYATTHYLYKEIIANQLTNLIINTMGITFMSRFIDEFKIDIAVIIHAFWIAYKLLNMQNVITRIEALDNIVHADVQTQMLIKIKKSVERLTRWLLRNFKNDVNLVNDTLTKYYDICQQLIQFLPQLLDSNEYLDIKETEEMLLINHVPNELALLIARCNVLPQILDIVIIANSYQHDLFAFASEYFYLGKILKIDWLLKHLIALPEDNKWQALSRSALLIDGYNLYSKLTHHAIKYAHSNIDNQFVKTWIAVKHNEIEQINKMFDELQDYKYLDLAMLSAIVHELSSIF